MDGSDANLPANFFSKDISFVVCLRQIPKQIMKILISQKPKLNIYKIIVGTTFSREFTAFIRISRELYIAFNKHF